MSRLSIIVAAVGLSAAAALWVAQRAVLDPLASPVAVITSPERLPVHMSEGAVLEPVSGNVVQQSAPQVDLVSVPMGGSDFVALMQRAVAQDRNGNYWVELSTVGFPSREFLVSTWPIFYPDETMLARGVEGCPLSGYYIELQAQASLLVVGAGGAREFHYRCVFDGATNQYLLQETAATEVLAVSVRQLARDVLEERG
ncbi:hypothetical protein [Microbulbifer sp. ALW1]|uniref:hypothetical protein n=1 Tax=Microbulbifer sp. (strain ALW1) TaxID=1516059 RepID=UPI001357E734|nr:hypothetical protein [Microbulbifer sp. ALW1]